MAPPAAATSRCWTPIIPLPTAWTDTPSWSPEGSRRHPLSRLETDPDGSWPVEIIDCLLSDERTGLQMLQTWVSSQRWVHRRVETITFLDERRVAATSAST